MNNFINYLSSPLGTIMVSAIVSVITALLTSEIIYWINNKRGKRRRLIEVCRNYIEEAYSLHTIFAEKIINNNGTNSANITNQMKANQFLQKIKNDNELFKLMRYFSINTKQINLIIEQYDINIKGGQYTFYNIVKDIEKEFGNIEQQL